MATVAPSIFYTEPSRWFMEQLLNLEPGTQNGGIYANKSGYHNTRNQNLPTNYSVIQPPDKLGPATKAAAYDWTFPTAQAGNYTLIDKYSSRLLAAGQANDPRTNGWREFYGQADADREVEGWDFYFNGPRTSDPSHLWHIHLSELREFTDDMNNKKAMLSILKGESLQDWLGGGGGDEMSSAEVNKIVLYTLVGFDYDGFPSTSDPDPYIANLASHLPGNTVAAVAARLQAQIDELKALVEAIDCSGGGDGGLTPHTHSIGTTGTSAPDA